jgi:hypothetical protein
MRALIIVGHANLTVFDYTLQRTHRKYGAFLLVSLYGKHRYFEPDDLIRSAPDGPLDNASRPRLRRGWFTFGQLNDFSATVLS